MQFLRIKISVPLLKFSQGEAKHKPFLSLCSHPPPHGLGKHWEHPSCLASQLILWACQGMILSLRAVLAFSGAPVCCLCYPQGCQDHTVGSVRQRLCPSKAGCQTCYRATLHAGVKDNTKRSLSTWKIQQKALKQLLSY